MSCIVASTEFGRTQTNSLVRENLRPVKIVEIYSTFGICIVDDLNTRDNY